MWPFQQPKSLHGDVVLITGGAMGIGRLMALKFASFGATVVVWDLNPEHGKRVVEDIQAAGATAAFYRVDVTDQDAVYSTARAVSTRFGGVDILVNNAGIVSANSVVDCNERMVERTMAVNATSHFWTIKSFLPSMLEKNKGHIVSIASVAGIFGCSGMVDYCASKFAAVGLMVSLRQELSSAGSNVKCTLVCPSFISTGMFEGVKPPRMTTWLTPEYVAAKVVDAVRYNQWKLVMPRQLALFEMLMATMPDCIAMGLTQWTDVGSAMKSFHQTRPQLE
ncbi:hypothetical protein ATCC90586_009691 [Pythium insidiosum]|nr:hypothetical protein ATCC90586_009691 [Pythium insidiosum]